MKIVTLVENSAPEGLREEHGLSLYLETLGKKILFDAGQSGAFAQNADALGVDLEAVDLAILSHGHYDHGNGLPRFLERNRQAPVYVSPYALQTHYGTEGSDVGVSGLLPGERVQFASDGQVLAPGLTLLSLPLPPSDTDKMTFLLDGQRVAEDFRHEQYLLIEEAGKRILISGCSHKGIVQIARWFQPDVLVGGFHFMNVTDESRLEDAARQLLELPTVYYTGHCTGQKQFAFLKERMGDRLHGFQTGTVMEL